MNELLRQMVRPPSSADVLALVGLVLVTIGAGLAWLPLGFFVPGALILVYVVLPDQQPETPK